MFSRSALRPLTLAAFRSAATNSARGAIKLPALGHPEKDRLGFLPENWVKGPVGVGVLAYICSGDFCAMRHEHSGLYIGLMEDEYYSSGLTLGILAAFAVMKLVPLIANWTDVEVNKIESGNEAELKVLCIAPPLEKKNLNQDNVSRSS
ncbi:ATP synthase subunit b, mitochondrial [Drosophila takahashii]|uniref:ATP synthase subunit b, mitochondrial n=1 Tax=Drosophila takahashii TaxID=29030 RepID=UPI001CF87270|nr:ATP synthase subunit b, mitochondrial [Drosophila takahashii]